MSLTSDREIECRCGARLGVTCADSVNAERHPHMRSAVLDRQLHVFHCQACETTLVVEKRFFYLDLGRGEFYGVWPTRDRVDERACSEAVVRAFEVALGEGAGVATRALFPRDSFNVRVCFGNEELREKMIAHEAGISDFVLEVLKARTLAETYKFGEIDLAKLGVQTMRLDHVEDNGDLAFFFERGTAPPSMLDIGMVVTRANFDALAAKPWEELYAAHPGIASGPHVSLLRLLLPAPPRA